MNLNMTGKITAGVVSTLSTVLIMSCSNQPVQEESAVSIPGKNIVASVEVGDDGKIEFVEEEPGCLVTSGLFLTKDYEPAFESMNPVELYEALKGEDAPAALKQAYRNALAVHNEKTVSDLPGIPELPEDAISQHLPKTAMRGRDFSQLYCNLPGYDFASCRTDMSSNTSFHKVSSYMRAFTNADSGSVTFVAQWYDYSASSWVTATTYLVNQGHTCYYAVAGSKKPRLFKVLKNGQRDWFHFSVMGNYELP